MQMSGKIIDLKKVEPTLEERREVVSILYNKPLIRSTILSFQEKFQFSARELASVLGLEVVESSFQDHRLAAFLHPLPNCEGWEIVVNEKISEANKRWAIIHELCHWIVDMNCEPPSFDQRRIPPLMIGSWVQTYSNFEVIINDRSVDLDGNVNIDAYLRYDPLVDEDLVRASERKANWLAGFILVPFNTLDQYKYVGDKVTYFSENLRVPRGVAAVQMALWINHKIRRQNSQVQ